MIGAIAQQLRRDSQGTSLMEFAIIAPVFLTLIMAVMDLGYREFIFSTLQGAVHKAARDGTLENGPAATSALDARVRNLVSPIVANGVWTFDRKNYQSFTRAGAQEKFTDSDGDNIRDATECYEDENGNSTWDADSGQSGQGGAKDITKYSVKVEFPRIFPLYGMLGWPANQTVSATTVIRNQPYDKQAARPVTVKCT
jgi:hypothetical protein